MGRPTTPIPTDWEMRLLKILWKRKKASVDDVREELRELGFKRSDSAVRKMLGILVHKGFAAAEVEGRANYYRAVVRQARVEKNIFQYVAELLFGGSEQQFVLRAMDNTEVNQEIVSKMKEIVTRYEKDSDAQ